MMIKKTLFFIIFYSLYILDSSAQRVSTTINSNWEFYKGNILGQKQQDLERLKWEEVSIPHTWNAKDVTDDEPGYYRGIGWYKKSIYIPENLKEKDVYLHFEGAGQVAEVFINGIFVGKHIGSYTGFNFKLNKFLKFGNGNTENIVLVKVDNSYNEDIAPLSGDFTFFGGIYRDVYLITANNIHFDMDNYASDGIFVTTPIVSKEKAEIQIKGLLVNNSFANSQINVTHQIIDDKGLLIASIEKDYKIKSGGSIKFDDDIKSILKPKLWSIDHPYLYKVLSSIRDKTTGKLLDQVSVPLGFRWYRFDAEKGFFLNGEPVKLIGTSRHQDYKDQGFALSDEQHVRDVELLKEMGGNFLRVSHYPQDISILQACDRLGILASVETPIVNEISETIGFKENAKRMHLEMIRQNYNHPSLIIWAYMNEVLLKPHYEKGSPQQENYFKNITQLAQELENLTRQEDAFRYTMIPNHGNFDLYNKVKLTQIPMLVGWNLYHGWYGGDFSGFAKFLDTNHKTLPDKPFLITEFGADADNRLHSFDPIRFDKTVEYTTLYHQAYLKTINERPFVAAAMIWNLADFSSESRAETLPHINSKGILTIDRKPKDAYRFYQANLLKEPFIQIGSREWVLRTGFEETEGSLYCNQPIIVFSNQAEVSLRQNNQLLGTAKTVDGMAEFKVPFVNGLNSLQAISGEITDQTDVYFKLRSQNLKNGKLPFDAINVSLGDKRFFYDEKQNIIWLPEQEYKKGSWGYVGGNVFVGAKKGRQTYGSDKNILGSELDPIYETQRYGLSGFKFDVLDGDYVVTLHFSELLSSIKREELAYNLTDTKGLERDFFEKRVFDVDINGVEVLSNFSNDEYLSPEKAISVKIPVTIKNSTGLNIDFKSVLSDPILNGIQLRKIR